MEGETGTLDMISELFYPATNPDPVVRRAWFVLRVYFPRILVESEPILPKTIASGGVPPAHHRGEGAARLRLAVNISIRSFTCVQQYYLVILLSILKCYQYMVNLRSRVREVPVFILALGRQNAKWPEIVFVVVSHGEA